MDRGTNTESTRAAVVRAYASVQGGQVGSDAIAFDAAVMVYRRLWPGVSEAQARDRVAQMLGDAMSTTVPDWEEDGPWRDSRGPSRSRAPEPPRESA
ncbi:hypothetical protein [Roseospira goensis]|uniref:Uncharacterized protein n=1 Tax=Roseospira goensis TaxID=391922 RepID=A0A7W6RXB9_9PROT|nr:hypothetical protein [Roseospira goensis]MBB4284801.1 hypothetical protein [Roseospira goensis]